MIHPIKMELPSVECKMGSVAFLDIGQLPSGKKLVGAPQMMEGVHICTSRKGMLELLQ